MPKVSIETLKTETQQKIDEWLAIAMTTFDADTRTIANHQANKLYRFYITL